MDDDFQQTFSVSEKMLAAGEGHDVFAVIGGLTLALIEAIVMSSADRTQAMRVAERACKTIKMTVDVAIPTKRPRAN